MDEHVHKWGDPRGTRFNYKESDGVVPIVCQGCGRVLRKHEAFDRLNATERLSVKDAWIILNTEVRSWPMIISSFGALKAYADILEGK